MKKILFLATLIGSAAAQSIYYGGALGLSINNIKVNGYVTDTNILSISKKPNYSQITPSVFIGSEFASWLNGGGGIRTTIEFWL